MAAVLDRFYGTGRRKTSVARVWIKPGSGHIVVNRRAFEDYFPRETLRMIIAQPLAITNTVGQFDVLATVKGGGPTGQAGAVRHGLARASGRSTASRAPARSSSTASGSVGGVTSIRVAVAGASGYMGAELLRLL